MALMPPTHRTAVYQPALAWFAALGGAWVFVLVALGAFTTSIGAGMAFPDWPLSNGSVNPAGWLEDVAMFAEHSHRLSGATMGLITIALAVWLWRAEERAWLRRLGWWAVALVVVQGVIGGQRVQLDALAVPGFTMTLGQMLRIPHGILAQVFVCLFLAIAAGLSRGWTEAPPAATGWRVRRLGALCVALLLVQLIVAATMRHNYAGLAIPTFPLTPEGGLWPSHWSFPVAIHFAHRLLAVALGAALTAFIAALRRDPAVPAAWRRGGVAILALVAGQTALGAGIIWTGRNPYVTTAHVLLGAVLLAAVFLFAFLVHRRPMTTSVEPASLASSGPVPAPA
jgi:cytochrome c oxidase assembly protein subunit 15